MSSPAIKGKQRCRMHGGSRGSGAQKGNHNATKHGFYTQAAITQRRYLKTLIQGSQQLIALFSEKN